MLRTISCWLHRTPAVVDGVAPAPFVPTEQEAEAASAVRSAETAIDAGIDRRQLDDRQCRRRGRTGRLNGNDRPKSA